MTLHMNRAQAPRRARLVGVALAGLLALSACGGNKSTWQLLIRTPPGDDLFKMGVTQVRLSVGDKVQTSSVNAGQFTVSIDIEEPKSDQYVRLRLEALDAAGQVVARGYSPNLVLSVGDSGSTTQVTLFVARRGKVSATAVSLIGDDLKTASGRRDLSVVSLRGRAVTPVAQTSTGVLIVGGSDATGAFPTRAWVYDPLSHGLLDGGKPKTPRRGAALVPSADANIGQQALFFGGADASGAVLGSAELFDPQVSSLDLVFSSPAAEVAGGKGAVGAVVAEVGAGVFLASGGVDKDGAAVPYANLLQRYTASDSTVRPGVKALVATMDPGPMLAARAGHSATPMTFADGVGALLFGGTNTADMQAEKFVLGATAGIGTFAKFPLKTAVAPRWDHVAFPLRDGRVLIAGGRDQGGQVLASALLIAANGEVEERADFLQTARAQAGLAVYGDEILICGGKGAQGVALASCEIFTQDVIATKVQGRVEAMPRPRVAPRLAALETGNLLIIGGTGLSDVPVAEIDAYTAP